MSHAILQEAIDLKDWELLEERWLSALADVAPSAQLLHRAAGAMRQLGQQGRLQSLLELTLPALQQAERHSDALAALRLLAEMRPEDADLRAQAIELYGRAHADDERIEEIVDRAQRNAPVGAASLVESFEMLLMYRTGCFVEDAKGWGFGRVTSVDLRRLEITVDFVEKPGHRIPISSAVEFLAVRDPEHFESKRLADPESLKREAVEDPASLIRRFLRSHGIPAPLKVVREAIVGAGIQEKHWSKLWTAAKKVLIHDPHVEISGSSQPTLSIRAQARTREDEVWQSLEGAGKTRDVVKLVRGYLAEPTSEHRAAFLDRITAELRRRADKLPNSEAGAFVELHYLLAEVAAAAGPAGIATAADCSAVITALLTDTGSFAERVAGMVTREFAVQFVRDMATHKPAGWEVALAGLFENEGVHTSARELANRECAGGEARRARDAALARVFASPRLLPEAFFWMSTKALEGKLDMSGVEGAGIVDLLERHLDLVGVLGAATAYDSASETKTMARNARKVVTEELLQEVLSSCDAARARQLSMALARNNELSPAYKAVARMLVLDRHPEAADALAQPEKVEDVIWTSAVGLRRRHKDYDHLLSVEIRANGVALGKARELGDLSENAEWDAAREEERRLIGKQKQMAEELDKARLIELGTGPAARISPGVQVRVRNLDNGEENTYTLLGPWDVDPTLGVISYMSPLGQALLGRARGEEVDVRLPTGGRSRLAVLEADWANLPE